MTGYIDGLKDGLRDVASLCEAIEKQAGKTNAEVIASVTAGLIRKSIVEKLARADTVARAVSASSHRGSSQ